MVVAEILLVMAGHSSSIFTTAVNNASPPTVAPAFAELLHPGEIESLQSLSRIAWRYTRIKNAKRSLCAPNNEGQISKYLSALYSTLNTILKTEYEELVIETEAKIIKRDDAFVASGSFVPLSSLLAAFAEWDAPFAAIQALLERISTSYDGTAPSGGQPPDWPPGKLIDLLLDYAGSGVGKIASIMSRVSIAVQRVWRTELTSFLVHGSLGSLSPYSLANPDQGYSLYPDSIPSCISFQTRESIVYVGKALVMVRSQAAQGQKQLPRQLANDHTKLLESALPQDRYAFDRVIASIRTNVSDWLWSNVLTKQMVNEALNSLSNYFLLRNGEFGLALIREIEKLKISRLTARNTGTRSASGVIREQDLQLALLRASLGTSAQHDTTLTRLKMTLPTGPLRPLLPSLSNPNISAIKPTQVKFNDVLLGTPTVMIYHLQWPLDLFLSPSDLQIYADLFAYISALRKVQNRVLECWVWLSNAQRQRRKWTGLGEGGTDGDDEGHKGDKNARRVLLRCGWGLVRDMLWFLDTLLSYVMSDVVEVELGRLREKLRLDQQSKAGGGGTRTRRNSHTNSTRPVSRDGTKAAVHEKAEGGSDQPSHQTKASKTKVADTQPSAADLDFTGLRAAHSRFLHILLTASLLAHPACASTVRTIMEVCERFVAQVERWGGDILPGLLDEGSISLINTEARDNVGSMVRERWKVVHDVNEALVSLLETFYEQLSTASSTQVQANVTAEMTMNGMSSIMPSAFLLGIQDKANGSMLLREKREGEGEVRRHIERLLLRLDFNGALSKWKADIEAAVSGGILQSAGLA